MDLGNISKLLPEFLEMFKGRDLKNLADITSSLGNTELLEKVLGQNSKYVKYLPLLPLLANLSKDGFKGLLNNSENIGPVLSALSGEGGKIAGLDVSAIASLLPLFTGFLNKKKTEEKPKAEESLLPAPVFKQEETQIPPVKIYNNPFAPIADITDRDILYTLNRYLTNN